jgi:hypothetical protein
VNKLLVNIPVHGQPTPLFGRALTFLVQKAYLQTSFGACECQNTPANTRRASSHGAKINSLTEEKKKLRSCRPWRLAACSLFQFFHFFAKEGKKARRKEDAKAVLLEILISIL